MTEHVYCASCHLALLRAHLVGDSPYCAQCLPHDWHNDEYEPVTVMECPRDNQNVEVIADIVQP